MIWKYQKNINLKKIKKIKNIYFFKSAFEKQKQMGSKKLFETVVEVAFQKILFLIYFLNF